MRGIYLLYLVTAFLIGYAAFPLSSTRTSLNQDPPSSSVTDVLSEHRSPEAVVKASDSQKITEDSTTTTADHGNGSLDSLNGTEFQSGRSTSEESQPSDSNTTSESTVTLRPGEEIGVEEPYVGNWGGGKNSYVIFESEKANLFLPYVLAFSPLTKTCQNV